MPKNERVIFSRENTRDSQDWRKICTRIIQRYDGCTKKEHENSGN